jgi:murein DD-endopeptidase MepM/ murein hydrolase activator NlpD
VKLWTALLVSLLVISPVLADNLKLEGSFQQGGLIFGETTPGSSVVFNGRKLRLSANGRFVFGFGRDAPKTAALEVTYPDGGSETRDLEVTQREYQVQRIDGLPSSKVTPPEEVWQRIKKENAEIAALRQVDRPAADFAKGFAWPARGVISGVYGSQRILNGKPKRPHYGLDIAAPTGTPVIAPADGVVVLAADDLYYTGGTIILDHGHGLSSAFLHMEAVTVEVGQSLKKGDPMGRLGATGRATGPHLDWRINWFNERIDPAFLVGPMPVPDG